MEIPMINRLNMVSNRILFISFLELFAPIPPKSIKEAFSIGGLPVYRTDNSLPHLALPKRLRCLLPLHLPSKMLPDSLPDEKALKASSIFGPLYLHCWYFFQKQPSSWLRLSQTRIKKIQPRDPVWEKANPHMPTLPPQRLPQKAAARMQADEAGVLQETKADNPFQSSLQKIHPDTT